MTHTTNPTDTLGTITAYHERSKHSLNGYAAGPGTINWDAQPDLFRRFAGGPTTDLPLAANTLTAAWPDVYSHSGTPRVPDITGIGILLELSLGLSAWKQYGTARWSLRCNPSSGNLHPTEAYVICVGIDGIADGVHHYCSHGHQLEQRCAIHTEQNAALNQALPDGQLLIGLSSVHWREAWKYGERAFRYCQHDTGHALAALRYAAATLGWTARLCDDWSDKQIATILGLDRDGDFGEAEREYPEVIIAVTTNTNHANPDVDALTTWLRNSDWQGSANILDRRHMYDWPVIAEVNAASAKPETVAETFSPIEWPTPVKSGCSTMIATIIRQRRSAQAFDGAGTMTATAFFRILDMTLPRHDTTPWDCWPYPPRAHLILFVHTVEGLKPGLYLLLRNPAMLETFRAAMREEFVWENVEGCPAHLPLYHLITADSRKAAATVSCHQTIAGNSCFSLGMLTEYKTALEQGPWYYRRLFWECGLIGQVLYLEAEAAGLRGTGIGCFFDDNVHSLLGLQDDRFQSLYHFTVGHAVYDARLATLPPYQHLKVNNRDN